MIELKYYKPILFIKLHILRVAAVRYGPRAANQSKNYNPSPVSFARNTLKPSLASIALAKRGLIND